MERYYDLSVATRLRSRQLLDKAITRTAHCSSVEVQVSMCVAYARWPWRLESTRQSTAVVDREKANGKIGTAVGAFMMAQPTLFHVAAMLPREEIAEMQSARENSTQKQGCVSGRRANREDVSTAVILIGAHAMRWNARYVGALTATLMLHRDLGVCV
jgi:hypothetical protein